MEKLTPLVRVEDHQKPTALLQVQQVRAELYPSTCYDTLQELMIS